MKDGPERQMSGGRTICHKSVINQMRDEKGLLAGPGTGEVKERTDKRLSDGTQ